MLRIVGLQRSSDASSEFLLLQNQGSLRLHLKGHAILADQVSDLAMPQAHVFPDDVDIQAGLFVLLSTGKGTPRWVKTKDGSLVYYAYMDRQRPVWSSAQLPLHVMTITHSYSERMNGCPLLR